MPGFPTRAISRAAPSRRRGSRLRVRMRCCGGRDRRCYIHSRRQGLRDRKVYAAAQRNSERSMIRAAVATVVAVILTCAGASAQTSLPVETAAARLDALLDRFPNAAPGFAVVAVTADNVLLSRVRGE